MRPTKIQSPVSMLRFSGEFPSPPMVRVRWEIAASPGRADQSCVRQKQQRMECADNCRSNLGLRSSAVESNAHCAGSIEDHQSDFDLCWPLGRTIVRLAPDRVESTPLPQVWRAPNTYRRLGSAFLSNIARGLFARAQSRAQIGRAHV